MRRIALAVVLCALASPVAAQNLPQTVRIGGGYTSLGYCQLTSIAAATALTTCSNYPTSTIALGVPVFVELCSEGVALRYRDDGTNPTSGAGMPVNTNTCFQYNGPLAAFKVIQTSTSGILDVTFYK